MSVMKAIKRITGSLLQKSLHGKERGEYTRNFIKVGKILERYLENYYLFTSSQMETRPKKKKQKRDMINPRIRDKFFDTHDLLREIALFTDYDTIFDLLVTNKSFKEALMHPIYDGTFWRDRLLNELDLFPYPLILIIEEEEEKEKSKKEKSKKEESKKEENDDEEHKWYNKNKVYFEKIQSIVYRVYRNRMDPPDSPIFLNGNEALLLRLLKTYELSYILKYYVNANEVLNTDFLLRVRGRRWGLPEFYPISKYVFSIIYDAGEKKKYDRKRVLLSFISSCGDWDGPYRIYDDYLISIITKGRNDYVHLLKDKDVVIAVIKKRYGLSSQRYPTILETFDKKFYSDRDVVLEAAKVVFYPSYLIRNISKDLKYDPEIMMALVQNKGRNLQDVPKDIENYRDIVLAAVKKDSSAIQYAPEFIEDEEVLKFVSPEVLKNL